MKRKEMRAELFEKMLSDYADQNDIVWKRIAKPHFRVISPTMTVDIFTTGLKYHIIETNSRGSLTDLNDAMNLVKFINN